MPEPSQLVLLEQLPTLSSGPKIRFLGCVHAYNANEACIVLRDKFPSTTQGHPTAIVAVENILENVNHELLQVGSWVNIMGYVRAESNAKEHCDKSSKGVDRGKASGSSVNVDATMIWSAGAIRLDKYRHAARQYQSLHSAKSNELCTAQW